MINTDDLKRGNLIEYIGKAYVVDGLNKSSVFIGEMIIDSNVINPIPITSEWLEKLGFIKEGNNVWLNSPLKIGINAGGSVSWVYYFDRHLSLTQLKHVDQLQNLFFVLTGEELTIQNEHIKSTS
jgi:hypothetical protein